MHKWYEECVKDADEKYREYINNGSVAEFRTRQSFLNDAISAKFAELESKVGNICSEF